MALVGALALALGAVAITWADDPPLSGTVGGMRSPAEGKLNLKVTGRSSGAAKLVDATVSVDGTTVGVLNLCPAGSDCQFVTAPAGDATLDIDTRDYTEGNHHVGVVIRDDAGHSVDVGRDVEVWNNRGPNCSPNCHADLSIGSDSTSEPQSPNPKPPGGGVEGASQNSCGSPRLSMSLAQKPLRVSHGVPVLLKNKSYRFTGRLTCLVNGKRKSASKGARIEVRNTLGGKVVSKPSGKVGNGGKITVLLKYPSSRTIEFRFTNADGTTSKVRIKVRIAQRKS